MKALDLTQGPIVRTLIAFTLPTLGSNVLQSLNASVNAIWVGHFLGEAPLTAATNANMVLFLLMAAVFGVAMATGIMVGQSVGARDLQQAKRVVGSSAVFMVILSVATALLGALTAEPILRLMSTPADAMPYAVSYLRIVFIATPSMFFYIYAAMVLRGAGDARTPFIFMFVSVGLDIALNPLLIFGPGPLPALGIRGAALAMLISQTTTLLAMIVLLYRRKHFLVIHRDELHYLRLDLGIVKVLVMRGLPMGLQMLIVSSSMLTVLGLDQRLWHRHGRGIWRGGASVDLRANAGVRSRCGRDRNGGAEHRRRALGARVAGDVGWRGHQRRHDRPAGADRLDLQQAGPGAVPARKAALRCRSPSTRT